MGCFTFYIYSRQGRCQYYHEWARAKAVRAGAGSQEEDFKLVFGLFWSMRMFCAAMDPKSQSKQQVGAPSRIGAGCTFYSFRTNNYKLHFLESPSGLKFVLTTDHSVGSMGEALSYIYSQLFVEYVAKNPLYTPGEPFLFEPFSHGLNRYMKSLGLIS